MPDESEHSEPRYVWFGPPTVQELRARLNAAGDDAILKVEGHGERMTLEVLEADPTDAEAKISVGGPLNEAHPCPPACL